MHTHTHCRCRSRIDAAFVHKHAQLASLKLSSTAAVIHDSRSPLNTRTLCAWPALRKRENGTQSEQRWRQHSNALPRTTTTLMNANSSHRKALSVATVRVQRCHSIHMCCHSQQRRNGQNKATGHLHSATWKNYPQYSKTIVVTAHIPHTPLQHNNTTPIAMSTTHGISANGKRHSTATTTRERAQLHND